MNKSVRTTDIGTYLYQEKFTSYILKLRRRAPFEEVPAPPS